MYGTTLLEGLKECDRDHERVGSSVLLGLTDRSPRWISGDPGEECRSSRACIRVNGNGVLERLNPLTGTDTPRGVLQQGSEIRSYPALPHAVSIRQKA